jgi:hypothetical protein
METRRVTIQNVSIGSAAKVGAVLTGLLMTIFGLFIVVLPGLMGASFMAMMMGDQAGSSFGVGLIGSLIAYVFLIVLYTILGGIGFAIYALLYNIVAGIVGGIEMDLS